MLLQRNIPNSVTLCYWFIAPFIASFIMHIFALFRRMLFSTVLTYFLIIANLFFFCKEKQYVNILNEMNKCRKGYGQF